MSVMCEGVQPMWVPQPLYRRVAAVVLVVLSLSAGSARGGQEGEAFDILGFRLGMDREQVEALFRQLNPDVKLDVRNAYFHYSDGLQNLQTEEFLGSISGPVRHDLSNQEILSVTVEFSPPPLGGRVVQITRSDNNIANPVTLAEFQQALIGKYGQPASQIYGLQWHFPAGRKLCSTAASGPVAGSLSSLVQGRDRELKYASPEQCASYLSFRMIGNPVKAVGARMVDVEQAIRAQLAASDWVAGLQEKAVAERIARGKGPQL
ncbi:hypothetical protein [Parahaliea aestuarii]|uniref:Uncharacterized protein n=1 Tax=Parahaliea aestuarii TaxID=1852021 RepID=A0A5C8ZV50_9GAMM|nr:hypothetical protein [Parahaliea aestuarii]TXS91699.1 hypothetical protein FVW59_11120 [Parahaliea aestuarii]